MEFCSLQLAPALAGSHQQPSPGMDHSLGQRVRSSVEPFAENAHAQAQIPECLHPRTMGGQPIPSEQFPKPPNFRVLRP